jgi:hypothetical protein
MPTVHLTAFLRYRTVLDEEERLSLDHAALVEGLSA